MVPPYGLAGDPDITVMLGTTVSANQRLRADSPPTPSRYIKKYKLFTPGRSEISAESNP
jgi:hypothetical protein